MLVDVFVSWVREINASSEAVQELIQYKDSPKARIRLDLRMLTEKEIDRLVKTANDDKGYGYRALATAVETFRALLEDANSQPIKDLRVLEAALIEHFRKTPNKWVFVVRNEHRVPYYVESVKHHSAERLSPAFVTLELQCGPCISDDGSEIIRWHAQDLSGKNKTVGQLLLAKNILTETELLVNVYHQEMESWRTHVLNVGEQYNAVGRATVLGGDSWSTDYIEMEHDGIPAKIVIDDGSETGYESRRDDRKRAGDNDQTTDASFWGVASNPKRKGKGKYEEDIADEEEFAVLPIPPFIPAFDLRRHQFVEIHVSDISPYEYDSKLRDKVVLPEGNLELMSILVAGADEVMEDIVKGKTGGTIVIATGPPGVGKCLGKGVKVIMANGETVNVESVCKGDRLMGPDGKARTVLSTTRGKGPLYRITPVKGESWVCNDVHMLTLVHTETDQIVDMPVNEWLKQSAWKKSRFKQFSVGIDKFERHSIRLPIDPYFLGLWFGDGSKFINEAGKLRSVAISKPDPEIRAVCETTAQQWELHIREQQQGTCPTYHLTTGNTGQIVPNRLLETIRILVGPMLNIPQEYLQAPRKTRLDFLAGYLDADSELANNCYTISQKRKDWARAIWWLARSLGFCATFYSKKGSYRRKDGSKFVGTYWVVSISGDTNLIPTRIPRKKASRRRQIKVATRTGISVTPIGRGTYYGFTLSGDGRFLLGDFTVTHNTLTAEMFSEEIKKPLYTIQCSQLGVDPKALEGQLGAVLNRAMRWKAILLIDEADVYVRARGDDIQQNAIVGIWLRVLEYYRGILFLTSNKDTMIDDAVMSRATAWVKYDYPDQDKLTQLWHVLSAQYAFELDGRHIRRLVDRWPRLSGRNIKNMLKLATQLRKVSKSDPLDLFERAACFLDLPKQPSNKDA